MDPYLALLFASPNNFRLADGLFSRISDKVDRESPSNLSREEAVVYDIWGTVGIIGNGGFEYLFTSDLEGYERIIESYELIGVPKVAEAFRSAIAMFPEAISFDDYDQRTERLFEFTEDEKKRLEELSTVVFDCDRQIKHRLGEYIRKHRQAFVGLEPTSWEDLQELRQKELKPPPLDANQEEVVTWLRSIDADVKLWDDIAEYPHLIEGYTLPTSGNPIVSVRLSDDRSSTDEELARISQYEALRELQQIDLWGTSISEGGMAHLVNFPNLVSVVLWSTNVQDDWLLILGSLPNLKDLNVSGTAVSDEGLKHIATLTKLEHLNLTGVQITDAGLSRLAVLKNLKTISLEDTLIGGSGFADVIPEFQELEALHLSRTKIGDADLETIGELQKLQVLYLSITKVTDNGLTYLAKLKNLQELNLDVTAINGSGFTQFARLESLERLGLFRTNVDDAGVAYLQKALELKELSLSKTRVTDESLVTLSQMTQLTSLELDDTAITGGPKLKQLEQLKSLEYLSLPTHLEGKENLRYLQGKLSDAHISF